MDVYSACRGARPSLSVPPGIHAIEPTELTRHPQDRGDRTGRSAYAPLLVAVSFVLSVVLLAVALIVISAWQVH